MHDPCSPRRGDAATNTERIIGAAVQQLCQRSRAAAVDIVRSSELERTTLYGRSTPRELVHAATPPESTATRRMLDTMTDNPVAKRALTKVKSRGVVSFRLLPEGGGQAVRESSGRAGSVCSLRVRMRLRMEMSEK